MATTTSKTRILETAGITPSRLRMALMHSLSRKRPLFVWGPPGIGKSDIVAQVARDLNRPLIDIRLPLMEPTDMRGIPYLAEVKVYDAAGNLMRDETDVPLTEKVFRWSNPSDLPTDPNSRALVFFDEMSAAPPSVQAATYQIILNRRIGTYQLPDDVVIVAAGNRVKDKGVAYNMPMPLANRFTHVTLETNIDDWKEWAIMNRVHKDVVGYLSFQPNDLMNFQPSADSYAFATPRSWYFASELLQEVGMDGEMRDANLPDDVLGDLIKGTVGEGPGVKFMTYRKQAANLPNAKDVLEGKITKLNNKQIDVMYALTTALCYELQDASRGVLEDAKKNEAFHAKTDTFFRFMMDNFADEMAVMGARTVLGTYKLPITANKLKNWVEFTKRYQDLIPNVN
jgi:ATPase family associated with various cellular activities (AAA)